jgi:hypothetical protein
LQLNFQKLSIESWPSVLEDELEQALEMDCRGRLQRNLPWHIEPKIAADVDSAESEFKISSFRQSLLEVV